MTIKEKIKEHALELILIKGMIGVPLGLSIDYGIKNENYYNSLSKQEKIEYLQNKLNSSQYKFPPIGPGPRGGGAMLALWSKAKRNMQNELTRLRIESQ